MAVVCCYAHAEKDPLRLVSVGVSYCMYYPGYILSRMIIREHFRILWGLFLVPILEGNHIITHIAHTVGGPHQEA